MPSSFARPDQLRRFTRPAVTRAAYGARMALAAAPESPAYVPSADDYVTGEVMLPEGASEIFRDRALLWNAVDARAGARLTDGRPGPVSGFGLLLGLPRLHELAVEEMAAMVRAFCMRFTACGLAVQWDLHAPGSADAASVDLDGAAIAVHAHVVVSARPVRGDQILRGRERRFDTVARPGVRIAYGWSHEWRMHQHGFFAKHGIALAVAVPSGAGEIPMGRDRFRVARREALQKKREDRRQQLRDPAALIELLLRDRWLVTRADVEALIHSAFVDPDERGALVARVIADPVLVTAPGWADGEAWTTPDWLQRVAHAIAHAERTQLPPLDPLEPPYDPDDPTAPEPDEAPPSTALSVEDGETLCDAVLRIAELIGHERIVVAAPTVAAYAAVEAVRKAGLTLTTAQELGRIGTAPSPLDRREPVILVPMPETLRDRELAALLQCAALSGAKLVPVADAGRAYCAPTSLLSEIMGGRARLASLRVFLPGDERGDEYAEREESAVDDPSIDLKEDAAIARIAELALRSGRVVVATRPDTVIRVAGAIRARRAARGEIVVAKSVRLGGLAVSPGDRIVVRSAWDRETPPRHQSRLERGAILTVIAVDQQLGHVEMRREDGGVLVLRSGQANGELAYADALPLRMAIAKPVAHHMVLDEPSTAVRALDLWWRTRERGILFVDATVETAAIAADKIVPWVAYATSAAVVEVEARQAPDEAAIDAGYDAENAAHATLDGDRSDDCDEPAPNDAHDTDPDDIDDSEVDLSDGTTFDETG